ISCAIGWPRQFWSETAHCRLLATLLNVALSWLPRVVAAETMATAISDAIRAYSIAVTPDSSLAKHAIKVFCQPPNTFKPDAIIIEIDSASDTPNQTDKILCAIDVF